MTKRALARERRGAVIALVGVTMLVLMGMLVLAIDGGNLQRQKRMAQTAADAGALAGAVEIFRNRPDSIPYSARSETKRNGFENGVAGDVITVTWPTTTGNFIGSKFVNVVVERTVPTAFASIFGRGSVVVRGRATAGVTVAESCFIVLDPSAANALELDNSAHLTGSGCGVQVNSTNPLGANAAGTQVQVTAPTISVGGTAVGGVDKFSPTPTYNSPPMADPMAGVAMPTIPNTCNYGTATAAAVFTGVVTLSPGTYCGGITVNGTFTLNPGVYYLRGGGLTLIGGSNTLRSTGTGTTFINTAPPTGATYGWAPIFVQAGSVTLDLFANTDPASALPGVLFYTDPAAPYMENLFKANSVSRMDGTMYFPTGKVKFESGASFTINGALVAYQVQMSQSVNVTFTGYNGGTQFLALKKATVVE
ncbi:MAG TPA: pilus assembly protein TadG-related protein [Gemmatimonadaceae bacterium]|nr:pilus assembly protein TadG-related protein [Gemmatimonadaceae bacterium]